jgi:hypothetical protein
MGFYARRPAQLLGQVAADLFVVIWAVLWGLVGRAAAGTVADVAAPARQTSTAARRLAEEFRAAAVEAAQVPGVGEALSRPFEAAAARVGELVAAADSQVASIERLATLTGWLVFAIPVAVAVALWLPRRIRFFLRARAAQRFLDSQADLDLFALRAMATQPMHVLARISDDPVSRWRAGDRAVIDRLAELELSRSGLRLPDRTGRSGTSG